MFCGRSTTLNNGDVITRWLDFRMPEIPFLRNSILIFSGGGCPWHRWGLRGGGDIWWSVSQISFSKILSHLSVYMFFCLVLACSIWWCCRNRFHYLGSSTSWRKRRRMGGRFNIAYMKSTTEMVYSLSWFNAWQVSSRLITTLFLSHVQSVCSSWEKIRYKTKSQKIKIERKEQNKRK